MHVKAGCPDRKICQCAKHFGMMENETYRESTYNKLKLYGQADIIPSVNLITTFETKSYPLDSEKIQKMIEDNLLKK